MTRPVLEFPRGERAPIELAVGENVIGRGAFCAIRVDGDGVAERHARVIVSANGTYAIQDLDSYGGTQRNGEFVYGQQPLTDGDEIRVGAAVLRFRLLRAAAAPSASQPQPAMPQRSPAPARTLIGVGPPPEVVAAMSAGRAPANRVVGAPEPEPTNNRTLQMDSSAIEALLAASPAPTAPAPTAPAQPWSSMSVDDENTTVGAPSFDDVQRDDRSSVAQRAADAASALKSRDRAAFAATMPPPAPLPPAPSQPAAGATLFAPAPDLSKIAPPAAPPAPPSPSPSPSPQPLVAPMPSAMPPGGATLQLEAPVLPSAPSAPPPPSAAQQPMGHDAVPQPVGYAPTTPVKPLPPPAATPTPGVPFGGAAYTPPTTKGAFGSVSRAFAFMQQMMTLAFANKALLKPILWNLVITTPLNIGVGVAMGFVSSRGGFYGVLALGTALLYFTDYLCNAFTASLMFDYATTGEADMKRARARVTKALPGVMTFAAVSAILDVASTYARERNDVAAKILLRVLRAIWTTATYVIMPALVIEGVSFGAAFKRSKSLMDQDPTGVGAGIVAMYLVSTVVSIVCYALAYGALRVGVLIHPAVGGILFFTFVNLYWSISGWFKIAYSTCFYMWARECERTGTTNQALAPLPLRAALDAA